MSHLQRSGGNWASQVGAVVAKTLAAAGSAAVPVAIASVPHVVGGTAAVTGTAAATGAATGTVAAAGTAAAAGAAAPVLVAAAPFLAIGAVGAGIAYLCLKD